MTPEGFSREQVERARRYHRPLYLAFAAEALLGFALLAALPLTGLGDALYRPLEPWPWWARTPVFAALAVAVPALARLPLAFWRGHLRERRFGFSTQSAAAWLADRAKALAVSAVLASGAVLGLVALARALPELWPLAAAPAAALLVLALGFAAPVLLEPLFDRFAPLPDEGLAAELRALAQRAGVPVRDVLVAEASRRTRKENAYVSGLGRTRRVVLFDTLLRGNDPRAVRLVVAHELGHRRDGHVAKSTALGTAGAALAVLGLWALLRLEPLRDAIGASGAGDPRVAPFVLLLGGVLQLLALPAVSALSRRWERAADRFALELTRDPAAFEAAMRRLAESNLSDLDPPRALYLLLFTHPTPRERIAVARRFASAATVA